MSRLSLIHIFMLTSPEDRILDARKELAHKGIFCEHTSAATYAAYQEFVETVGPLHDCLIPVSYTHLECMIEIG